MANKKFVKVAALALLCTIGLTACDDSVIAKPTGYDKDAVIDIAGEDDLYHNLASIVYDSYRDGSLAADVLDKVLYEYSVSMLGRYNKLCGSSSGTTLKEAVAHADDADKTLINKFVKEHKAYWSVNADGKRVNDAGDVVKDDADASAREIARVKEKWDSIEERIAEAMYAKISGGSYTERSLFSEKKFLKALKFDMKKVADYKNSATVVNAEQILDPDYEDKQVWEKFLTRNNYQQNFNLNEDETNNTITYVEDEIIPTIYRTLLTEQYILDMTYNTLGRASARKINVFSITNNDKYDRAAGSLMNHLVNKINTKDSDVTLASFKDYAKVWKGVGIDSTNTIAADLLSTGAFVSATAKDGTNYIKGTKYGDMMENYDKIDDDPLLTDTSVEADFTGSNTYVKEIGKTLKEREIALTDYTITGWYTKSAGVEGLPSTITTRLFNIGTAAALDRAIDEKNPDTDRFADGATADASKDYNAYVAKINGKFYLKNDSAEQGDDANDILFYDRDSKTYYVVQIEEAVNATKFSKTAARNYEKIYNDPAKMQEYVNAVLKVVAKGDSYESLSKKHWLEEMNLKYHDTVVYEYFKTNFPDLFEDD